jgi:hypothetical protein
MTDTDEDIQYLAEVAYPHGPYTDKGTILVLREAFTKGYKQALVHNPQPDDSPKNNPPVPEDTAAGVAQDIFDLFTDAAKSHKADRAVRDLIDGFSRATQRPKH